MNHPVAIRAEYGKLVHVGYSFSLRQEYFMVDFAEIPSQVEVPLCKGSNPHASHASLPVSLSTACFFFAANALFRSRPKMLHETGSFLQRPRSQSQTK